MVVNEGKYTVYTFIRDFGVNRKIMGAEPPETFSKIYHLLWLRMHIPILGLLWVARKHDSTWQHFTRLHVDQSILVKHPRI